ncbi:glycosyltransferase family 4 protein [Aquimarina agarilytica]|uniref:glycosyltransferase family 4 protein n=1 Tax=Aquimarina agarilytica TaxID=1087449 RepID=UPI000287A495|nr:glycosyltransferase family 4 protein [Aquimarina agarilytica]
MKGINIIGHTDGEFGLGKALRLNLKALKHTDISYKVFDFKNLISSGMCDFEHEINIVQVSLHEVNEIIDNLPADFFEKYYTILYLVWESEFVPEKYHYNINLFDEIWTASTYCKRIFTSFFKGEITVIPHPVEIKKNKKKDCDLLEIYDSNKFSFLYVFDFNSSALRKNPFFLVKAFKIASDKVDHKIELILKTSNSHHHVKDYEKLKQLIDSVFNIKLLDGRVERDDLNSLMNSCDCYISLHHSEGFGLTMAEAMSLGKPTIATNYSGNTEFMDITNSFLVDTVIETVKNTDVHFDKNTTWGNPLLEDSIKKIVYVFSNPREVKIKAEKGERDIGNMLSFRSIGGLIRSRIIDIESSFYIYENYKRKLNYFRSQAIDNALRLVQKERELKKIKKNILLKFILKLKKG